VPRIAPDSGHLRDVYETRRLISYLAGLWVRRSYMWYVAVSELRSRQVVSTLGNFWHLLNPILQMLVYWLVFGLLVDGVTRGVDNYLLFLAVGVFLYLDFQRAAVAGASSIQNNKGLIRSLHFPRAIIPITAVLTESLAAVPSVCVIYATAFLTGAPFRWTWLCLPLVFASQFFLNVGSGLIAARASAHFSDFQQILPFLFRLGFYFSGVLFAVEAFANESQLRLFEVNPAYCFIETGRWTMSGGDLNIAWIVSGAVWIVVLPVIALLWFQRGEELYGRD